MKTTPFDAAATTPCPHCNGTGLCAQAAILSNHSHQWLECDDCGKGIPAVIDIDFDAETHRPVCSLCAGTGLLRNRVKAATACAR